MYVNGRCLFDVKRVPKHSNHVSCLHYIRVNIAARLPQQHHIRKEITCNHLEVVIWSAGRMDHRCLALSLTVEACSLVIEIRNIPCTFSATSASVSHTSRSVTSTHQSAGRASFASVLSRSLPKCVFNAWVQPVHTTLLLGEVEVHIWSSSCRQNSFALCDLFHCKRYKDVELTTVGKYC